MHPDTGTLILAGVVAQLLGSLAKTLFRKPAQQAQIDRIESGVNTALAQVAPLLSALQTPTAATAGKDTAP